MRVYSNVVFNGPQLRYITNLAKIYPGRWLNLCTYRVNHISPIKIETYSPLIYLQENIPYYCHDKYYVNKRLSHLKNVSDLISVYDTPFHKYNPFNNSHKERGITDKKIMIFYPRYIEAGDLIVIRDTHPYYFPEFVNTSLA